MSAEPDRVETVAHVTDHVAAGLARLTDRWRGKPVVRAVLAAWLAEVQAVEDAFWSVLSLRIDTATGDALAQYGALLGVSDPGGGQYVHLIRAATQAIRSSGTGDDLWRVLLAIKQDPTAWGLREYFPASLVVEPTDYVGVPGAMVAGVLGRAVAGGVRVLVVDVPNGHTFAWSDTDETVTDSDRGFSDVAGLVGGKLVGVIDAST